MIRNIYTYTLSVISLFSLVLLSGCSDEENMMEVEREWRAYQQKCINDVAAQGTYNQIIVENLPNTVVYHRFSNNINSSIGISPNFTINSSDSVSLRYIGWYKQLDGTEYIFDSTESGENPKAKNFKVEDLIGGLYVLLQTARMDQEWEVCIPYNLGYGEEGSRDIPGHTTLWYNIKVEKVFN